jgi:hypothetical protein
LGPEDSDLLGVVDHEHAVPIGIGRSRNSPLSHDAPQKGQIRFGGLGRKELGVGHLARGIVDRSHQRDRGLILSQPPVDRRIQLQEFALALPPRTA